MSKFIYGETHFEVSNLVTSSNAECEITVKFKGRTIRFHYIDYNASKKCDNTLIIDKLFQLKMITDALFETCDHAPDYFYYSSYSDALRHDRIRCSRYTRDELAYLCNTYKQERDIYKKLTCILITEQDWNEFSKAITEAWSFYCSKAAIFDKDYREKRKQMNAKIAQWIIDHKSDLEKYIDT